jgi:hypothetical protein
MFDGIFLFCRSQKINMKKITLFLFICFFSFRAFSQTTIELKDVAAHIGDSVKLTGKVFSSRYLEGAKDAPTLLNIGAAYPDQLVTVVIYGKDRVNFKLAPESAFKDKVVTFTGKVELYKGKPQIVVRDESGLFLAPGEK